MQCVNCQFENMPGTASCVRCGTSMSLATSVLVLEPPRAGKLKKRLRSWSPRIHGMSDAIPSAGSIWQELRRPVDVGDLRPALVLRMLVPGWAHWYGGYGVRGALFFAAYLIAGLWTLATYGSAASAPALGLVVAIHACSITDLWIGLEGSAVDRYLVLPAVALVGMLCLYGTLTWVATNSIPARQLTANAPPFESGDVLLVSRWATPRAGDLVMYRLKKGYVRLGSHGEFRAVGERFDRILAGPGSTVVWSNGQLSVDGVASDVRPMNPNRLPALLTLQVPPNQYCILPSTDPGFNTGLPLPAWQFYALVPSENVAGRVVARTYPYSRWGFLR